MYLPKSFVYRLAGNHLDRAYASQRSHTSASTKTFDMGEAQLGNSQCAHLGVVRHLCFVVLAGQFGPPCKKPLHVSSATATHTELVQLFETSRTYRYKVEPTRTEHELGCRSFIGGG